MFNPTGIFAVLGFAVVFPSHFDNCFMPQTQSGYPDSSSVLVLPRHNVSSATACCLPGLSHARHLWPGCPRLQTWAGALGHIQCSVPGESLLLVPKQLQLLPPHLCSPGAFQAVWNSLCCVGMFPAFGKVFLHSPVLSCSTKCSLPISWRVWVSSPRMCCGQDWCSVTLGSRSCALSWAFGYFWELFSQIKGVSSWILIYAWSYS